jgi:hypothetical protein
MKLEPTLKVGDCVSFTEKDIYEHYENENPIYGVVTEVKYVDYAKVWNYIVISEAGERHAFPQSNNLQFDLKRTRSRKIASFLADN